MNIERATRTPTVVPAPTVARALAARLAHAIHEEASACEQDGRLAAWVHYGRQDEHRVLVLDQASDMHVEFTTIESPESVGGSCVSATLHGIAPALAEKVARLLARGA